jgi:hypothetical protein
MSTPTLDTTLETFRTDVLAAVKQGQDLTLDAVKTVTDFVRPIVEALPTPPLAADLFEAQAEFSRRLFEVVAPKTSAA